MPLPLRRNAAFHVPLAALVLLAAIAAVTPAAAQRPVRTLCSIPAADLTPAALHVKHAVAFYAASLPSIDWQHRLLGNGDVTTRNFVSAWAINGTSQCDAMIGPGFSYLAIAMSPLMDTPWFDFGATSVELSDKTQHPAFSRVIPTDEVGARAASAAMLRFGWRTVSIFCVDDGYGRSVAGGVSADLGANGGGVDVRRCLPGTTTRDRVRAALQDIRNGNSRVVFAAMLPTQQTYQLFLEVMLEENLQNELIVFFSEAMCSLADRSYARLHGSFCATYTMNPTIMGPFMASYWQRDVAAIQAELRRMGLSSADASTYGNSTDIYAQLAHDATHHVMEAMHQHLTTGNTSALVPFVRGYRSTGASGLIQLDSNGDRITADAAVFNARPGDVEFDVGRVVGGAFSFLNPGPDGAAPEMYMLGRMTTEYPPAVDPTPATAAPEESNAGLVIGLSVTAGVLLILIGVALASGRLTAPKTRDNGAAPKEAGKPFTVVFTDIQSSTSLWASCPVETSEAIEMHHTVVRKVIAKHHGYEVKTIGDAFMVAFIKPKDAIRFALAVQEELYAADWGPGGEKVDRLYRESLLEKHPNDHPRYVQREVYDDLWSGIRVRIGIHYGEGDIKFDEVSLGYDYYGTVVNTAARVEAVGHGGQVCCTMPFAEALGGIAELENYGVVTDLGEVQLRGLNEQTHIIQVLPPSLEGRVFPPLRLEVEVEDGLEDDDDDEVGSTVESGASSAVSAMMGGGDGEGMHFVESCALKHGKRFGMHGAAALSFAKRCGDYYTLVQSMLSTSKPQKKAAIVFHIGFKWRLPVGNEQQLVNDKKKYDEVLVAAIAKSVRAMDKQAGGAPMSGTFIPTLAGKQGAGRRNSRRSSKVGFGSTTPSGTYHSPRSPGQNASSPRSGRQTNDLVITDADAGPNSTTPTPSSRRGGASRTGTPPPTTMPAPPTPDAV